MLCPPGYQNFKTKKAIELFAISICNNIMPHFNCLPSLNSIQVEVDQSVPAIQSFNKLTNVFYFGISDGPNFYYF